MSQFLESFIEQGHKNLEAVTVVSEKIVETERQIEREVVKSTLKKGAARGKVTIILGTDESTTVDLKLTYIVSNVHWKPTYELHATTENGKPSPSVALHYRARVTQSTGEDWNNTSLTLSTVASDTMFKRIPELAPIKIRPQPSPFFHSNNNSNKGGSLFGPPKNNTGTVHTWQTQQARSDFSFGPAITEPSSGQQTGGGFGSNTALSGDQRQLMLMQQQRDIGQQQPQTSFGAFGGLFGGAAPFAPVAQPQPAAGAVFGAPAAPTDDQDQDYEDVAAPVPVTEPTTIVIETPIAISYSVHGESTIPSDGIEHQVSVAVLPFEANVSYVAIPRIEPRVYLQCQVKNTSEYRLLPGPVSVILDDSYVSKTYISDVNTGDNFDCTLGDDVATKITYSRTSRSAKDDGGAFSEAMKTTTYSTQISIHNKHAFTIPDLVVCDIVPTCDDKRVKVILRKPVGLADAKEGQVVTDNERGGLKIMWSKVVDGKGGEKEGKFEWRWSVAAGAKVMLEAQWEIKAPADIIWAETTS